MLKSMANVATIAREEAEEWRREYEDFWGGGQGRGPVWRARTYALAIARCYEAFGEGKLSAAGSAGEPTARFSKLIHYAFKAGGLHENWEEAAKWAVQQCRAEPRPNHASLNVEKAP
jgi:hypothetical protein